MKKNMFKSVLILLLLLLSPNLSYPLEVETHEDINEYIARNNLSGFSLDSYLRDILKFEKGITTSFDSFEVWQWLREGGKKEDIPVWYLPYVRSLNHFHNPITEEGFKGNCLQSSLCVSSTVWALMPLGTQSSLTGNYSWYDVRAYYYTALTGKDYSGNIIAADKTQRDAYFAETFQGLGQLMHLVQDASVPAHTRNDGHVLYNYEDWVKNNPGSVNTASSSPIFFNGTINNIASFIDTNQYNGTNPQSTVNNNTIGLSEYTNANFFSEDTIFQGYLHPAKENTSAALVEQQAEDGEIDQSYYIKGYQSDKLAAYSYFTNLAISGVPEGWKYTLDDAVYEDYAQKLIPRAVGYSAGLLHYFFRGSINIFPDDATGSGYVIANSTDENMSGTFELWYDNTNNERIKLQTWSLSIVKKSLGNNKSTNITFTPPIDAKEKNKYILVFSGRLGNESRAVVGAAIQLCKGEWVQDGEYTCRGYAGGSPGECTAYSGNIKEYFSYTCGSDTPPQNQCPITAFVPCGGCAIYNEYYYTTYEWRCL